MKARTSTQMVTKEGNLHKKSNIVCVNNLPCLAMSVINLNKLCRVGNFIINCKYFVIFKVQVKFT